MPRGKLGIGEVDGGLKLERAAVSLGARHPHARVRPRGEGQVSVSRGRHGGDVVAVDARIDAQAVERGARRSDVSCYETLVEQLRVRQSRGVIIRHRHHALRTRTRTTTTTTPVSLSFSSSPSPSVFIGLVVVVSSSSSMMMNGGDNVGEEGEGGGGVGGVMGVDI